MSARTQSVPDCPLQKGGRGWLWRVVELEPTLGVGHGSQMAPELFPSYSRPRCPFGRGSAKFSRGVKIDEKKEKKRQAYCGSELGISRTNRGGERSEPSPSQEYPTAPSGSWPPQLGSLPEVPDWSQHRSKAPQHSPKRSTAQSAAQPKACANQRTLPRTAMWITRCGPVAAALAEARREKRSKRMTHDDGIISDCTRGFAKIEMKMIPRNKR